MPPDPPSLVCLGPMQIRHPCNPPSKNPGYGPANDTPIARYYVDITLYRLLSNTHTQIMHPLKNISSANHFSV